MSRQPEFERLLLLAELSRTGAAMSTAMLAGDIEEARFLASLTAARAQEEGVDHIASAANHVAKLLGPAGSLPTAGYGSAMLRLADIIGHGDNGLSSAP